MGAGISSNITANQSIQQSNNQIIQEINQGCSPVCQNEISNIDIEAGNITGDITFDQACTVQGTCVITTTADAVAKTAFETVQRTQTDTPFLFFGLNLNVTTNMTVQDISQMIQQRLSAVCNPTSQNTATNVKIIAKNTISGNVTFKQSGNVVVDCSLQAGASALSSVSGVSQQTTIAGMSVLQFILLIILAIAVIVAIIFIIRSSSAGKKNKQCQAKLAEMSA